MSEQRVSSETLEDRIEEMMGMPTGPGHAATLEERTALDLRDARAEIEALRTEITQVDMELRREREWRQRAEAQVERLKAELQPLTYDAERIDHMKRHHRITQSKRSSTWSARQASNAAREDEPS